MEQERSQKHRATARHGHRYFAHSITGLDRLSWRQSAEPMRSRHYPQCSIALIAVVEVYAQRQHFLQYGNWRLHKNLTFFLRPTCATSAIHASGDWNAEILMKCHEPVLVGRLIEQRALHRLGNFRPKFAE
jgi:hypothetical protein